MYTFQIKESGPDIDIVIMRALLAIAGIACLVYGSAYTLLNVVVFLVLVSSGVFIKHILQKMITSKIVLLGAAGLILFFVTGSVGLPVFLILYGIVAKRIYTKSFIRVDAAGLIIKKWYQSPVHLWSELSNVVLKDNLLTIDFKNNCLLQVTTEETVEPVEPGEFNLFCARQLAKSPAGHAGKVTN